MLTELFLKAALIGAEWVLWLLVVLSILSVLAMVERALFYGKRNIDLQKIRLHLEKLLDKKDLDGAAKYLEEQGDSMESRVVLFGLRDWRSGVASVEDRMSGAIATEKQRYNKHLPFLGTVGNNAPFIGLFGTVLGIIGAFDSLADGSQDAAQQVMGAISEALVATGVGLLVAIPAVIAFNIFRSRISKSVAQTDLLGRTLLAHMHREDDSSADAPKRTDGSAE